MTEETNYLEQINDMLDLCRPDRYEQGEYGWLDPVIADIAALIPPADAQLRAARDIVVRKEGDATKRTNRLLREVVSTGQVPLDWMDLLSSPLAVGDERVALRACTPDDFRRFAAKERRAAANEFASRNDSCEGALFLADLIEDKGLTFAADIPTPAVES